MQTQQKARSLAFNRGTQTQAQGGTGSKWKIPTLLLVVFGLILASSAGAFAKFAKSDTNGLAIPPTLGAQLTADLDQSAGTEYGEIDVGKTFTATGGTYGEATPQQYAAEQSQLTITATGAQTATYRIQPLASEQFTAIHVQGLIEQRAEYGKITDSAGAIIFADIAGTGRATEYGTTVTANTYEPPTVDTGNGALNVSEADTSASAVQGSEVTL
jgi:hypothetical protein